MRNLLKTVEEGGIYNPLYIKVCNMNRLLTKGVRTKRRITH